MKHLGYVHLTLADKHLRDARFALRMASNYVGNQEERNEINRNVDLLDRRSTRLQEIINGCR